MAPVSVVIPCFRCAGTVRRAVLSVVAQTEPPLELILVDDASDDGTPALLEALKRELNLDWMRVIALRENGGAAAARNVGWDAARGEFVAFLDGDDSWLPRKLERQVAFMRAHPQFAVTGHRAQYEGRRAHDGNGYREIGRGAVLLKNPMVTPSLMVRRDIALRFDGSSRYMEDHRFLQEAVFSGLRVARLEEVLAVVSKPAFGAGGLSARLWPMEQGELDNYRKLRSSGRIGALPHALLAAYSLAKFCRRTALVGLRKLTASLR